MRHIKATEQSQETAALYALGALTQMEARAFEFHLLEGCPACETLARHFEKIVSGLGYATTEAEPAFYLRDVLTARIEREPRTTPAVPASQVEQSFRKEAADIALQGYSPGTSLKPAKLFPRVLAVLLVVSTALFFYMWKTTERRLNQALIYERDKGAAIRDEATRLESLTKADQTKSREIEQINMALSSPGTETFLLTPQKADDSSAVVLFWNRQKNRGVVIGHLAPAPAGKDYQLWLMVPPNSKISEGLLEPDSTGRFFRLIDIPPVYAKITAVAVTVEPKGGSEQPTTRAFALSR